MASDPFDPFAERLGSDENRGPGGVTQHDQFFFLNSENSRVIVSRLVPMSCAISSCVSDRRARAFPFLTSPRIAVSNKNRASLSQTEWDDPITRNSS